MKRCPQQNRGEEEICVCRFSRRESLRNRIPEALEHPPARQLRKGTPRFLGRLAPEQHPVMVRMIQPIVAVRHGSGAKLFCRARGPGGHYVHMLPQLSKAGFGDRPKELLLIAEVKVDACRGNAYLPCNRTQGKSLL